MVWIQRFRVFGCRFVAAWWICLLFANLSSAQDIKRGWAGSNPAQANAANARWLYNWGHVPPAGIHGEFVPMFWGGGNVASKIQDILQYENVYYVLGFNEPERPDQANMSVELAIERWAEIEEGLAGSGIKLVSPAVSDTVDGRAWLEDFMQQAEANDLTVDEVAFHWYGFVNPANPVSSANSFLNKVDQYHNNYGRNVWVTEFAGIDWDDNYTVEQMQQANAVFFSVVVPGLESRPYVTRYSMWAFNDDCRPLVENGDGVQVPTIVGDQYIPAHFSDETVVLGPEVLTTDHIHLRGGEIRYDGEGTNSGIGALSVLSNHDGSLVAGKIGGTHDWDMNNGEVLIEANSTLRKIDPNQISFRNSRFVNHGLIRLFESGAGSFWIHGPDSEFEGEGAIRLDANSTLRLGNSADETGFELPYEFQCRGGTIQITGDDIELSGQLTCFLQTAFDVAGSVRVTGGLTQPMGGGGSGIVKQGAGVLTLIGDQPINGNIIVNAGALVMNGNLPTDLVVNENAEVRGMANVAGQTTVYGRMKPGSNVGSFTTFLCEFQTGSMLEFDIGGGGVSDSLVTTGPLIIGNGVTLKINLVGEVEPSPGNAYNVLNVAAVVGEFEFLDLPELQEGHWELDSLYESGMIRVVEQDVLLGDINLDGAVNLLDVGPFVSLVSSGGYQAEADTNQDGVVNLLDVDPFVAVLGG